MKIKQKYTILLVFLFSLGFSAGSAFQVSPAQASAVTANNIIQLVNESRLDNSLSIVTADEQLTAAAQAKLDDMFARQYFSHNAPDGTEPWYWIEQGGYDYRYAGENLAIHFSRAEDQHRAWMESPTHRKNILNPEYTDIGVAVSSGEWQGDNTTLVVQFFAAPMVAANAPVQGVSEVRQEAALNESAMLENKASQNSLANIPALVSSTASDLQRDAVTWWQAYGVQALVYGALALTAIYLVLVMTWVGLLIRWQIKTFAQ